MAKEEKPIHRVQMMEGKRNIIRQPLEEYDIQSAEDILDAPKDLFGGTIKEIMEAEIDDHLGYEKSEPLTAMITAMDISASGSTAVTALWKSRCRRIVKPTLHRR